MPAQHPAATFETRNASATSPGLRLETHNTFAPENWTKNTHFSPAKAMTVSVTARSAPAKAMAVSNPRKHARAKATGVSDNRAAYPTGHRRGTRGRTTLQTSSNRSNLKPLARTPVTNVVNLRPKTTIFSEKAVGLTTFVTTRNRKARKRGADGERAGRRPRAHTAARPSEQARQQPRPTAPGTPVAPQAPATRTPGYAKGAGTEVPAPCRLTQPRPRRGSGRMTVSPGDGDASTGTCRQRRPLPGQPRRSGRRSRCGRGPASAWWPGRRARRNRSSRR